MFICLFAFVCTFCDYAMTYKDCLGTRLTIIGRTWYSLHISCEWISFLFIISLKCRNLQVWFAFRFSEICFMSALSKLKTDRGPLLEYLGNETTKMIIRVYCMMHLCLFQSRDFLIRCILSHISSTAITTILMHCLSVW